MRTGKLLFCLLCSLIATNGFSQNVRDLMQSFNEYAAAHPVEKIYLHLDKPYYAAGEYMYFRAYLTDIDLNQEAVESHIIYVELSDERKEIVKRTLLYSDSTEYAGQFLLPDSLPSANYHLRAYTNWMRNAGEDYFYHRDIYIGHPTDKKEIKAKPFDYEVAFFPEGGQLLQGVKNKVAFKALGNDGFGANAVGVLKDEAGNEVLRFHSTHLGMGSFIFIPESGKKYSATVESNGRSKEYPIPSAVNGMGLSIEQTPDSIRLTIRSTESSSTPIRVIAQSRHTICYALTGQCQDKEQIVLIPKDKFPTGIAQFTLFKDNQPVSERLAFIDRNDDLRITITPDKEKYNDRDKVQLTITVTDKDNNPVEGSFSLAVTDDKVVIPSIHTENIKGSLLLDSDLKGFIEQPGWYFDGDEPERQEALDNLLCTQGWTRYDWKQIEAISKINYPVESEFKITGKLVNILGQPIKDGTVALFSNNKKIIPDLAKTDKDGVFGFLGFDCPDSTFFVLQGRNKRDQRTFLDVKLDKTNTRSPISISPLTQVEYESILSPTFIEQAKQQQKYEASTWQIELPAVEVTATKNEAAEQRKIWFGMTGRTIGREDIKNFEPIGYSLTKKIRIRPPSLGRAIHSYSSDRDPINILIVDGNEDDFNSWTDYYQHLPGYMFESVEIVTGAGRSMFGARVADNAIIIVIKLRKPQEIAEIFEAPTPGLVKYFPEGYCMRKEFYVPAYDKPEVKQSPTPDLRTTIYWSPVVIIDKEGNGHIQFYAADNVASYTYTLEGTTSNQLGYANKTSLDHRK